MTLNDPIGESLFADLTEGVLTSDYIGLNWSYSRREALEHCTRRYFYQYYCEALKDPRLRARVLFLKSVKNRYLRTGELVHLVIATYLKKRKLNRILSEAWLSKWAKELFDKDRRYSEHVRNGGGVTTEQYPPTLLDEVVSQSGDEGSLLTQAEKQMLECIANFFGSVELSGLRQLGESQNSLVERKFSLSGFPVCVSGKIDAAIGSDSEATVVDWKTGMSSDGGTESLQLATYGIWAAAQFGLRADQVRIAKVYLLGQNTVYFNASEEAFANAKARVLQDVERMVILHKYGRLGTIEAFTPNPQLGVCRLCQFRGICPEGKAVIDAGN